MTGEVIHYNNPEKIYQATTAKGPPHPIYYAIFLLNKIISNKGFLKKNTLEMLLYNVEKELAHFSISEVRFWSGLTIL
jgi:hypothetical protein